MRVFTIDNETGKIAIHATVHQASTVANAMRFRTEAALSRLAADWPTSRLINVWNGLPGVTPASRFRDRATAVSRIWKAIQTLSSAAKVASQQLPDVETVRSSAKDSTKKASGAATSAGMPRDGSKASEVIATLMRNGGTTVEEIMTAMGWQKHTTRAMLSAGGSLAKKHGLIITSEKVGDQRRYSVKS